MNRHFDSDRFSLPFVPQMSVKLFAIAAFVIGITTCSHAQQPKLTKEPRMKPAEGFAVVELFTSQGCSSCPPADENLAEITEQSEKKGERVVTLSFHVDYWNNLGWPDPYSTADATKRQRLYAGVHGSKQVYTPQMIVNGTTELLGSSREKSRAAIQSAIKKRHQSELVATSAIQDGEVVVSWHAQGLQPNDLLNVALVQDSVQDKVESGENGGRTLKHINVVREFHVVSPSMDKGELNIKIPRGVDAKNLHVVAYLQSRTDASISAVAEIDIE